MTAALWITGGLLAWLVVSTGLALLIGKMIRLADEAADREAGIR